MRFLAFAVSLIFLVSFAQAEQKDATGASNDRQIEIKDGRVTMALKDAPAKEVLDTLFQAADKEYVFSQNAYPGAHSTKITLRLVNSPFDQALDAVTTAAGLIYSVENGVYTISSSVSGFGSPTRAYTPDSRPAVPSPIRLQLSAMPVEEAYQSIIKASGVPDVLNWRFEGDLGKTIMPGARFLGIPVEMAARIVVAASGLVPPTATERTITKRGPVDFAALPTQDWGEGRNVTFPLAEYMGPDKQWRYFILAHKSPIANTISLLFGDRVGYVVGEAEYVGRGFVSIRLVNVTLEQALKAILGSTGYTYRIEDGVYVIQQTSNPSQDQPAAKPAEQGTE
jgi:hypothetical protein